MTARDMLPAIGASVAVRFEEVLVNCTVKNVKQTYGRTRLLVAPVAGMGEQWVELPRVAVIKRPGVTTGVKRMPGQCSLCGRPDGEHHPDCDKWDSHVDNYDTGVSQ